MWKKCLVHPDGIELLSLLVSVLYLHVSISWLLFVFDFTIITDLTLLKLKMTDLTMSNSRICNLFVFIILACFMNFSVSYVIPWHLSAQAFTYLLSFPTPRTALAICWASLWLTYALPYMHLLWVSLGYFHSIKCIFLLLLLVHSIEFFTFFCFLC